MMDKKGVRKYLSTVGDNVDLVVMPREVLSYIGKGRYSLPAMMMIQHLMGVDVMGEGRGYFPMNKSEFGECAYLLRCLPKLREKLPEMAEVSQEWAKLVTKWNALEADYYSRALGRTSTTIYDPRDIAFNDA